MSGLGKVFQNKTLNYWGFLVGLLIILLFSSLIFAYIRAETATNLYLKEIKNISELCETAENPDFKYAKVINYEKALTKAKVYCIYEDSSKNLELNLILEEDKGRIYLIKKINKDRNLYWPVYI